MQLSESACCSMQIMSASESVAQLCITHNLQVSQLQHKLFANNQDLQLVQVRTMLLAIKQT